MRATAWPRMPNRTSQRAERQENVSMQQPPELNPDPLAGFVAELSKRLDSMERRLDGIERRLNRIETYQREDTQALRQQIDAGLDNVNQRLDAGLDNVNQRLDAGLDNVNQRLNAGLDNVNRRIDAVNQRILWVIGTQIALMGLLLAALKLT